MRINISQILFLSLLIVLSSCKSTRNTLTYFEDIKTVSQGEFINPASPLQIVPDDVLLITVNSQEPEATAAYNVPVINPANRANVYLSNIPLQQTYIVDSKGYINFPQIGKMKVKGMTTEKLADELTSLIEKDVVDPYVRVELVNFKIQVLGEVARPGAITVNKERFTLLDAIAAAGDLTPYGQRDNILLIRQEDGINRYYHINMNDSQTLSSPLFYLKQNDVLIVEPNEIRKANSRYNQDNAFKLSIISTVVSAASVIASLAIALAVK